MILHLFLSLLLLSSLLLLIVNSRHRQLWIFVVFGAGVYLAYHLLWLYQHQPGTGFVYHWISYHRLQADFNLSGVSAVKRLMLPFLAMAGVLLYFNSLYQPETQRLKVNALILLNMASFLLLVSAADYIQLMLGSSCFTILGFYLMEKMEIKRKFIFYNFLAEMALFSAFAIVFSSIGSISLDAASKFSRYGNHKDLVAVLLLAGIYAKAGLFLFQNQLLDMQNLTFNRILVFCFTGSPLGAMVLAVKLYPLLSISPLLPLLSVIICAASLLWGFFGALIVDNLKAKALYFNLMFYAFAFYLLGSRPQSLEEQLVFVLPTVLLLDLMLMLVNLSSSNELYVSLMGGFARRLKVTFALSLLAVGAFFSVLVVLPPPFPFETRMLYAGASLLVLAHLFHNIFLGPENADERVAALLRNAGFFYLFPLLLLASALIYGFKGYQQPKFWIAAALFAGLMFTAPLRFFNRLAENETVQDGDLLEKIYHLFVLLPLRLLGRVLWIAVDFVVIERSIIGTISDGSGFLVNVLNRVQTPSWRHNFWLTALGMVLAALSVGYYCYE